MSPDRHVGVAAFDFDGTLSTRDNVVPFLRLVAGTGACASAVARSGVAIARAGRAGWSREGLKEELVRRIFAGRATDQIDDLARGFADEVVRSHLRSEMVQRADWHRTQGHALVIVSASFATYLRPIAKHLRFDAVLATELEAGADGLLTGRLRGANVRGPEKARRLDEWLAGEQVRVWAYGDSAGDRELWARADEAVRVGRRAARGTGV